MAATVPDPDSIRVFASEQAFERWLSKHHDKASEIFVRMYKKSSGIATVTPLQAIDVALCWGWIDGIRKGDDEQSFLQRFTPRRAKSVWSQINRNNVQRLIDAGRMTPHGLRQVEAAKADGRWDAAYAGARTMTMPEDLLTALRAEPRALALFERLDKSNRYALAWRLHNLKTAAGRAKRVSAFVAMLKEGKTIHPMAEKAAAARPAAAKDKAPKPVAKSSRAGSERTAKPTKAKKAEKTSRTKRA